jgi:hypothetical protein
LTGLVTDTVTACVKALYFSLTVLGRICDLQSCGIFAGNL